MFLRADKTVVLGETDGPLPKDATGVWSQEADGTFTMKIFRTFQAGQKGTEPTDMGEFTFTVERDFTGEMSRVGASVAMTGSIYDRDDVFGDRQVGFFSMIDTTNEKLGDVTRTRGRTQTS